MFFNNYNKVGPGIPKNMPKKKGVALFFDILKREFWSIIGLNLLFLICSIPVVTIGASYAALNHVVVKMIRDEPVEVIYEFKRGLKLNYKQGTMLTLLFTLIMVCCAFSYFFYMERFEYMGYLMVGIATITVIVFTYAFPMIASVDLSFKNIMKNSLILSFIDIKRTALVIVANVFMFLFNFFFFPVNIPIMLFFSFAPQAYVLAFCVYGMIDKYIIKENSEIEQDAQPGIDPELL